MTTGTHVRVRKLRPVENPCFPTPAKENFIPGQDNGEVSLPVEYTVKGALVFPLKVGSDIVVHRYERNGVRVPGILHSSPIQKIEGNFVSTTNSVYEITELEGPVPYI